MRPLWLESAETLRQRLYTRRDELAEGELPVPLKLVHINKCPVRAAQGLARGGYPAPELDLPACHERADALREQRHVWSPKLDEVYREEGSSVWTIRNSNSMTAFWASAIGGCAIGFARWRRQSLLGNSATSMMYG